MARGRIVTERSIEDFSFANVSSKTECCYYVQRCMIVGGLELIIVAIFATLMPCTSLLIHLYHILIMSAQ